MFCRRPLRILVALVAMLFACNGLASADFEPTDFPQKLAGTHFTIYYKTAGADAVTAEYAQSVLTTAERLYEQMVVKAGFRAPRALPTPIALMTMEGRAGSVYTQHLGFEQWMQIGPAEKDPAELSTVIAHELFHVLQSAYNKGGSRPEWAVEGTASVSTAFLFEPGSAPWKRVMRGHLSLYWGQPDVSLKETDYMPNLFFYWLASQYGELRFLNRLLTWSENLGWERAVQLSAIEGGAPAGTTFDKLWRSFVLAMVDGRMPVAYETSMWFYPTPLTWSGQETAFTHGQEFTGYTQMNKAYAYKRPLVLAPYSFELIDIRHLTSMSFDLTVTGDPDAIEAYVVKPGPLVKPALESYDKRPNRDKPGAPPTDPTTVGARIPVGSPVRVDGQWNDRTVVLLLRLGTWGHGNYSLKLTPASGAAKPDFQPLAKLPHGSDSAGSPPPLTAQEEKALTAGSLLQGAVPFDGSVSATKSAVVKLKVGEKQMTVNDTVVELPFAVTRDPQGRVWMPARTVARALGATIDGNRFTFDNDWVDVVPHQLTLTSSRGRFGQDGAAQSEGDELKTTTRWLTFIGCDHKHVKYANGVEEITLSYPKTRP